MSLAPNQMCIKAKSQYGINETILSFSCGKDSLAAWCVLASNGIKVYPVYHYVFPGLSFIERSLAYYEKRFQTEILRMPHPWLTYALYWGALTDPQGMVTLTESDFVFRPRDWAKLMDDIRAHFNKPDLWYVVGVKACDSINRMQTVNKVQGFDAAHKKWYPLGYASDRINIEILRRHNMPVPDDYFIWGRSFDCLTTQFTLGLAQHYPEDYKRILECFPLLESQFMRDKI